MGVGGGVDVRERRWVGDGDVAGSVALHTGSAGPQAVSGKGKASRSSKKKAKRERAAEEEDAEEIEAPTTKKLKLQASGHLRRH